MGMLSKLDAVNRILRGASEDPVSSLTTSPVNETLMAEQVLDETNIREQMSGLHCNTLVVDLEPDETTGLIYLPEDLLQVQAWANAQSGVNSLDLNLSVRGNENSLRLYDVDNVTDVFEDTVCVQYTLLTDFEDLPTAIQFQIADIAATVYQMAVQGDGNKHQVLSQTAQHSRALGRAQNIRAQQFNAFTRGRFGGPRQMVRYPLFRRWF